MNPKILTREEIMERAPVCFQNESHNRRSSKYSFISTERLINDLEKLNWHVVDAKQVKSKKWNGFQKHMVSFENPDVVLREVGDSKPRIVIANSFDGFSSFDMMYGIFRLICENGMIVASEMYQKLNLQHKGYTMTQVEENVYAYIQEIPKIAEEISNYKETILEFPEKYDFAKSALEIRYPNIQSGEDLPILPECLLEVRRVEDKASDLWTVMNVVQENIIKAGNQSRIKGRQVRGIKSINGTINMNRALWTLMANMYQRLK